ncbi:MAG TPA: UDP-N-acetylglucosamine 2-epimerase (non-hydrolyzing) [Chitinophagaceae bacterium]|nr:UDP-N-acetylglucosamine 2-epimerase (non-hydrolyzing) [Chitinophagaceae bacterium]
MKKIISVVGARPNFMKIAPVHLEFLKYKDRVQHLICHTGQHYDEKMSKIFFQELNISEPDFNLNVGSGSHAVQTANIMLEFEKVLLAEKPNLVIVVGDVNSTIACSLVSKKLNIPVAHIEAGLRSFDRTMPEEINRVLTDSISDYLFVTEQSGIDNLKNEGIDGARIFFAGNVMIDSLVQNMNKIDSSSVLSSLDLKRNNYVLCTLHRPSNVDNRFSLKQILETLKSLAEKKKIVFPVHPRTRSNMEEFGIGLNASSNLLFTDPIGYIDFLSLIKNASLVITDSGGIQEETTYLGVPCVTLRDNTERPVTVSIGSNHLAGTNVSKMAAIVTDILNGNVKKSSVPLLWDGKAAQRISRAIMNII